MSPENGSENVGVTRFDAEMVELALCLPDWQVMRLEAVAHQRGLTTGQLLRWLIQDTLTGFLTPSTN